MDILKSPSCFSWHLQDDHLDIVAGIKSVLEASKSMAEKDPMQWQIPKLVCSRIKDDSDNKVYQGAVLWGHSATALSQCAGIALRDSKS